MLSIKEEYPLTDVSNPYAVTVFNSLVARVIEAVTSVTDKMIIIIVTIKGSFTIILFILLTLNVDILISDNFNFFIRK